MNTSDPHIADANTTNATHIQLVHRAAKIIKSNRYLTLATCQNNRPWAAPVAFTVEPDFSLVFYTALEARHTRQLIDNPLVAGAIYDSTEPSDTAFGVQFQGQCSEVQENLLEAVMNRYFQNSFPDPQTRAAWSRPPEDFTGKAPQRFFRIQLLELGTGDPLSVKVDKRINLDLEEVKEAYFQEIVIL